MAEQHPLTDDLCHQIWQDNKDNWLMWQEPCPSTRRLIRAAADWQLEQVLNWCSKYVHTKSVDALREAMRPTAKQDN